MSLTRAGSTPSTAKDVVSTRCGAGEGDALAGRLVARGLHGVVDGRVQGVVDHHLQDEVDPARAGRGRGWILPGWPFRS